MRILNNPSEYARFAQDAADPSAPTIFLVYVEWEKPDVFSLSLLTKFQLYDSSAGFTAGPLLRWRYICRNDMFAPRVINELHLIKNRFYIELTRGPLFLPPIRLQEKLHCGLNFEDVWSRESSNSLILLENHLAPYMSYHYAHLYPNGTFGCEVTANPSLPSWAKHVQRSIDTFR